MNPRHLVISLLVHGSAIGLAVASGVFASEQRRRVPRVEFVALEHHLTPPEDELREERLPVEPEVRDSLPPLPPDPEIPPPPFPDHERLPQVLVDPVEVERVDPRLLLTRVVVVPRPETAVEPAPAPTPPVVEVPLPAPKPREVPAPRPVEVRTPASPLAENVPPGYPSHEHAMGVEGTVVVGATIDRFGVVTKVRLIERSRHVGFNRAALAAVRHWRFEPATVDGVPVAEEIPVTIEFHIEDAGR